MSCNDTNPCTQTDPCNQYDNCGCLNPTSFECVDSPGSGLTAIGVTTTMNGKDVLLAINGKVAELQAAKGKVLLDGDDSCPEYLVDKLEAGLNITIEQTGTGCDKKLVISAVDGGVPIDVNAKVSSNDTTSGYLNTKIETGTYLIKSILSPSGNEKLQIDVVPSTLISTDSGNQLTIGADGALKTAYFAPDGSETKIIEGTGVQLSGTGTIADPYVIATNPSIQIVRSCFDNTWRNLTLVATGNANVVYVSGAPQYRYRFDGSVEFIGSLTYTIAFGAYSSSNRKYTITIGNMPTSCLSLGELAGTSDLKSINYIDIPQASADQITQLYGYVIRKATQNIIIEFQSSFTGATSKTVVVNFEGCISHPTI